MRGVFSVLRSKFSVLLRQHNKVRAELELTFGALGGVLQFETAAGGVARVGERLVAVSLTLAVEGLELAEWVYHFAPHFEVIGVRASEFEWYGGDGTGIGGDVVAYAAVAARHGLHKLAVLVGEPYGHTVVLELASVAEHRVAKQFACACLEVHYLVYRVGVAQREHREAVRHLTEGLVDLPSHSLGGRVGRRQLGVLPFKVGELAQQFVKLIVAH